MLGRIGLDSQSQSFPHRELQIEQIGFGFHATAPSGGRCDPSLSVAGHIPQQLAEFFHERISQHPFD
jgi:hypothetical protein